MLSKFGHRDQAKVWYTEVVICNRSAADQHHLVSRCGNKACGKGITRTRHDVPGADG
jgi:hypothetical protein